MKNKTKKGQSVFINGRGRGKGVRECAADLAKEVPGPGVSVCWGERTGATYKSIPSKDTLDSRGQSGSDCECVTEPSWSGCREGEKSPE